MLLKTEYMDEKYDEDRIEEMLKYYPRECQRVQGGWVDEIKKCVEWQLLQTETNERVFRKAFIRQ